MSHIFEALQRAEEERSGGVAKQPAESVAEILQAADLLQATESEAVGVASDSTLMPVADRKVEREIQDFANAKILVPAPPEKARLVCLTDQGSLGAEKFRVLGLRLRHMRE